MFDGAVIMVTGGTGSFGKEFLRTVLERFEPKKLIVFSRDELKQYEMQQIKPFSDDRIRYFIGDVRDKDRVSLATRSGVDLLVHAAALKQVPALEYNPFEAVKTNVIGTQNVIDASIESNVRRVIGLSTDKAAAPINLYGATKLTADKLFSSANNYVNTKEIRFSVVRYGNVMGSRGSVVPTFLKKKHDGFLPITDQRMTRFSITLREGVEFVLSAFEKMLGGEIFVPKIPSFKITDLAEAIAPGLRREFIGIRPGEKLHEEMITESDSLNTVEFDDYFTIVPNSIYQSWSLDQFEAESGDNSGRACPDSYSYNSATNDVFLTVDELRALIKKI